MRGALRYCTAPRSFWYCKALCRACKPACREALTHSDADLSHSDGDDEFQSEGDACWYGAGGVSHGCVEGGLRGGEVCWMFRLLKSVLLVALVVPKKFVDEVVVGIQAPPAYSSCVSIRQHTSAYVRSSTSTSLRTSAL